HGTRQATQSILPIPFVIFRRPVSRWSDLGIIQYCHDRYSVPVGASKIGNGSDDFSLRGHGPFYDDEDQVDIAQQQPWVDHRHDRGCINDDILEFLSRSLKQLRELLTVDDGVRRGSAAT